MITTRFVEQLIKGKLVEIIFEMMFRQAGYRVTHFGYEYTASEFLRDEIQQFEGNDEVLKEIRNSPDFIVTTPENHIHFVEVKFQSKLRPDLLLKMAHKTQGRWNHAWFFVATRKGFYFAPCERVIDANGEISVLNENLIPITLQETYQKILNNYLPNQA